MQEATFADLGLAKKLVSLLSERNILTPTPIQVQAIPVVLQGTDVVGIAQTGTGKTFAFGLPLIERLARLKKQGLILLPTRELALQVDEELRGIGAGLGMRTAVLIGGASMFAQKQKLRAKPHVIIATPGRLVDHLQQKTVSLAHTGVLVLDEADRMFDMGFAPQLNTILSSVPKERQTLLFSATMPDAIMNLAKNHMRAPVRIEVAPAGTTVDKIAQEIILVPKFDKHTMLVTILREHPGSVLVFSRTKHGARKIALALRENNFTAGELHANLSLQQRKASLESFKSGKTRVLVATDIAARGVDVRDLSLVVNFDLPDNPEDYVHRIGRTGRAGKEGKAVSFVTPDQKQLIRTIERLIGKQIPVSGKSTVSRSSSFTESATPRKPFSRPQQRSLAPRGHAPRRFPVRTTAPTASASTSSGSSSAKPRRVFI